MRFWSAPWVIVFMLISAPWAMAQGVGEDALNEKFKPDRHYYISLRDLSRKAFVHEEYTKAIDYSVQAIMYAVRYDPAEYTAYEELGDIYRHVARENEAVWSFWQAIKMLDAFKVEGAEEARKRLVKKLRFAATARLPVEFKGLLKDEEEKLPEREFLVFVPIDKTGVMKTLIRGIKAKDFPDFLAAEKAEWGVGRREASPLILVCQIESEIPYATVAGVLAVASDMKFAAVRLSYQVTGSGIVHQATYPLPVDLMETLTARPEDEPQTEAHIAQEELDTTVRVQRERVDLRGADGTWIIPVTESTSETVETILRKVREIRVELDKTWYAMKELNRNPDNTPMLEALRFRIILQPEGVADTAFLLTLINALQEARVAPLYWGPSVSQQ